MKRQFLKTLSLIVFAMLGVLTVGCSGASSGNIPKENLPISQIAREKQDSFDSFNQKEYDKVTPFSSSATVIETGHDGISLYNKKIKYDKTLDMNLKKNERELKITSDSALEFTPELLETSKIKRIENKGMICFVKDSVEPKTYTLNLEKGLYSSRSLMTKPRIYVMDGFKGSTLKINGDFDAGDRTKIVLGLYIDEKKNTVTTDKVYINGDVGVSYPGIKVNFYYNEKIVRNSKSAKPKEEDYVIKSKGKIYYGMESEAFLLEDTHYMVGPNVYELDYSKKELNGTDEHTWKLKRKE